MSKKIFIVCLLLFTCFHAALSQAPIPIPPGSSWAETKKHQAGTISILWYDIEPFIYRQSNLEIVGVEFELMEGFKDYLWAEYAIRLDINWVDAGSFEIIYPSIKASTDKGLFAVSFYSITEERKKEVKFSPPYMPDLNVLVTHPNLPAFETDQEFVQLLPKLSGYTMKSTTMESDMKSLQAKSSNYFPLYTSINDYEVLEQIAEHKNAFGYVPVSIYVVALQRGIKIKRQRILSALRTGFAAIYTLSSDWDEPVNAYFQSPECKALVSALIEKYLGQEIAQIILEVSTADSNHQANASDLELLTKEREIVTQRLIDTALDAERTKAQRNIFMLVVVTVLLLSLILYSRFRTKNRINKLLQQRNKIIALQNNKMEELNGQLELKMLQAKLNPHFLFNSLNAIQYHISMGNKKEALQYISRFSVFLRNLLKKTDLLRIQVSEEVELANQYLWLEQNRFPGQFDYSIQIQAGAEQAETPPMLIHPILQAALYKHILHNHDRTDLYLRIEFEGDDQMLRIKITDNGNSLELKKESNGLPDSDVEEVEFLIGRIEQINKVARLPIVLEFESESPINSTILSIPQPLFSDKNIIT